MKLLKKLLPLGIVATTAAAVVPMAVSCGKEGISDFNYLPDIEQHEAKVFEFQTDPQEAYLAANEEYTAKVNENPNIIIEDLYWDVAKTQKARKISDERNYLNVKYAFNVSVKNVSLTKTTVSESQYYLLSYDFELNFDEGFDGIYFSNNQKVIKNDRTICTEIVHIYNVPVFVQYIGNSWYIQGDRRILNDEQLLAVSPDFVFSYDYKEKWILTTTVESNVTVDEHNEVLAWKFDKDNSDYDEVLDSVDFRSYYLANCSIAQKP